MKFIKESNNLYKVKTTTSPAGLTLHSDTEQVYFIDIIYIFIHIQIYRYVQTQTHIHTYTYFCQPS